MSSFLIFCECFMSPFLFNECLFGWFIVNAKDCVMVDELLKAKKSQQYIVSDGNLHVIEVVNHIEDKEDQAVSVQE